ncbi:MAG: hypothetical protein WBY24_16750, partial [Candidatus Acidiferrales bacterium]
VYRCFTFYKPPVSLPVSLTDRTPLRTYWFHEVPNEVPEEASGEVPDEVPNNVPWRGFSYCASAD